MMSQHHPSRSRSSKRSSRASCPSVGFLETRQLLSGTTLDQFLLPSPNASPRSIVEGPDGNLWFAEYGGNIGRITLGGQITEFPIPTLPGVAPPHPTEIISGPGGDLWFLDEGDGKVGRVTPQGQITEFSVPGNPYAVGSIAAGADGNLWFTYNPNSFVFNVGASEIGRMTPDGQSTLFPLPKTGTASALTACPDGDIWFLDSPDGKVGSITPDGQITETTEPTPNYLSGITTATDGALWYVTDNSLVRLVPGGQVQSFPLMAGVPSAMVAGPDGSLVFLVGPSYDDKTSPVIVQESRDSVPTNITISTGDPGNPFSGPGNADSLSYGPDGNLWLSGTNSTIDRVDLVPTPPPPPMLVGQGVDAVSPVGEEIELPLADVESIPGISVTSSTIDWGDGSASPGTPLGIDPSNPYQISGEHVYSAAGTYNGFVTVTGVDSTGKTDTLTLPTTIKAVDPTPVSEPLSPVEQASGIAFSAQLVARFETPTPHDPRGTDFTATIDWGDGTAPATGTVVNDGFLVFSTPSPPNSSIGGTSNAIPAPSGYSFSVEGGHTYASPGNYTIQVTIVDKAGYKATASTPAHVDSDPILLTPSPASTTLEPIQDQLTVATLRDFRGVDPSRTYTATIDWGDGSAPTSGTLTPVDHFIIEAIVAPPGSFAATPDNQFELEGHHAYTKVGNDSISYTVTDSDGHVAQGTTTAQVNRENLELALPREGYVLRIAAGEPATALSLTTLLTTDKGETASDFTATVDWGDGTPVSTATIETDSSGVEIDPSSSFHLFSIFGDHTFNAPGVYQATINVTSVDGSTAQYVTNISVVLPSVSGALGSSAYPVIIASFTSDEPNASPKDFTAVIDSGDGSPPEAGTIQIDTFATMPGQTNFTVMDNHVYTQSGMYPILVKIKGGDGVTVEVTSRADISIPTSTEGGSGSSTATPGQPSGPTITTPPSPPNAPPTSPGNDPTQTPGQSPNLVDSPTTNVPTVGPLPYPLPTFLTTSPGQSSAKPTTAKHKAKVHSSPLPHQTKQAIIPPYLAGSGKSASPSTTHQTHIRVAFHQAGRVLIHSKGLPTGPKKPSTTR